MRRSSLFISIALVALATAAKPLSLIVPRDMLVNRAGFSHAVYDSKKNLLRLSLSTDEKYRLWTPLDKISPAMIRATLAQEDRWFFYHPGVNPVSLMRGAILTAFDGARSGGSTITMQLARLRYGLRTRSIFGKMKQVAAALVLETLFSKNEILEAYLNLAPYGGNIEGVGAAARIYFGKEARNLSDGEAATLGVIPQRPVVRYPDGSNSSRSSIALARARLFQRYDEPVSAGPALEQVTAVGGRADLPFRAPHFVQRVIRLFPEESEIVSSLDAGLQAAIERQITQYIERNDRLGLRNASAILIDWESMKVRAYAGSADYFGTSIHGFVDGIQARRSPGSALKPFLYALALQEGIIHPGSVLKDTAFSRSNYNPENFEKDFVGPISATDALVRSRNIPAVSLLNELSPGAFYRLLRESGIGSMREESFYGLSLVLGGVEVRMDELAALYAMLANGGAIKNISFAENGAPGPGRRIFSKEASRLVLEMMAANPRPAQLPDAANRLGELSIPWKTGTSFAFRDAWAAGIVGRYVLVVWIGNFDGTANPAFIGRDAAGPLFFSIADSLSAAERLRENWRDETPAIKKIRVCAVSGELPGPDCRHLKDSWFIPGVSPIHTCSLHRKVFIDGARGVRTCDTSAVRGTESILEFWPSDLLKLFAEAGLPRKAPPPPAPECALEIVSGKAPLITSPDPHIMYVLHGARDKIPFNAVVDADARKVFWFIDDAFAGEGPPGETLFWAGTPGKYVVRAVDDRGRANETTLEITAS